MNVRMFAIPPLEQDNRMVFRATIGVVPAYMAAIAVAEALGLLLGVVAGVLAHCILLPLLLSHYVLADRASYRRVLPVLALAPLLRILSVTMPIRQVPQMYWYAIVGVPLLAAVGLTVRLLNLSWPDMGLHVRSWPPQILIACTGLPLGIATFFILRPRPLLAVFNWRDAIIAAAILLIFTGFTEELIFRGLLQQLTGEVYGRASVLCSSILFVIMYTRSPSFGYLLFIGLLGLFFGWCVNRTGSIWGVILAHGILNIALFLILPYASDGPAPATTTIVLWLLWGGVAIAVIALGVLAFSAGIILQPYRAPATPTNELRALRRSRGLSYVELARRTGLPARRLAEIEHGLRPVVPEHLGLIARTLGVTPQLLSPVTWQNQ